MAPGGSKPAERLIRVGAALAVTFFGLAAAVPAGAPAASLPPVQVTYTGKMSEEVFPTAGKPAHTLRSIDWSATANSAGSDGSEALDFGSVGGSASATGNNNCYDETASFSLAGAKNPVAGGWNLNETSDYPDKGWKYIAAGVPALIPVLESITGRCSSVTSEELLQTNELLLTQETFSAAQQKEYEELFDPLEFSPGTPASRTRTFTFDGTSRCKCLPAETHVIESMTVSISVTSSAAGNTIKTEPAPGRGGARSPKEAPARRKVSEARRKELKELARADLKPALEEAWKAHGLSSALGLVSGTTFSNVLNELGEPSALLEGNDATVRVIDDYRIIEDPPDRHFHQLARPRGGSKRPSLRSCGAVAPGEKGLCESLRGAELQLLADDARADALTGALLVTINRDSGAIRARDYAAAQQQYLHFKNLHGKLRSVLRNKGKSGTRVAAVLRSAGVGGVLSTGQSAAAISAVEARLSQARVPAAKLDALAESALQPHEASSLDALVSSGG